MRLDKFLADTGRGTRKEIKELIRNGRVVVDGTCIKDPSKHVEETKNKVSVNGEVIKYSRFIYLMMNKPKGVISATQDTNSKTVLDLIPQEFKRAGLYPVGRLDKDTEGLLLITNDGPLGHKLLSPKNHIPKTYYAQLDTYPNPETEKLFKDGILLDDGYKTMPAMVKIRSEEGKITAEIIINEGKYHQVKRMFKSVGSNVMYLKRLKMAGIALDETLKEGCVRELTQEEIKLIGGEIYS